MNYRFNIQTFNKQSQISIRNKWKRRHCLDEQTLSGIMFQAPEKRGPHCFIHIFMRLRNEENYLLRPNLLRSISTSTF